MSSQTPEEWRGIVSKQAAIESFINNPTRDTLHNALSELWVIQRSINNIDYFLDENFLADQTPNEIAETINEARQTKNPAPVQDLDGFGWPTATEVLSAVEPADFVLMNARSVAAMEDLGYTVANPKSASLKQYREFCEDVKDAVRRYPLREHAAEIKGEAASEETPEHLIADLCFAYHYSDDHSFDLTTIEEDPLTALTEFGILTDEFRTEIQNKVSDSPLYDDSREFLRTAIRNELTRR
jgi:hypothetical protein